MRAAREHGDVVVATVFVNPRQFHDASDLDNYPRTPERDAAICESNGVDCLVEPTLADMWPDHPAPTATTVSVRGISERLEGVGRPGHFDGVASVVAKLFTVTGPCRAYFGEKDFQQLAVVRQMVRDLAFDVDVVGCPIVRDDDGLAISSRNVLLSDVARGRALALSRALAMVKEVARSASAHRALMRWVLEREEIEVAYADVVDPMTFQTCDDDDEGERRAMIAAVVDGVRLIDNVQVVVAKGEH
jgi:pantoate--beta-alanine ligase